MFCANIFHLLSSLYLQIHWKIKVVKIKDVRQNTEYLFSLEITEFEKAFREYVQRLHCVILKTGI